MIVDGICCNSQADEDATARVSMIVRVEGVTNIVQKAQDVECARLVLRLPEDGLGDLVGAVRCGIHVGKAAGSKGCEGGGHARVPFGLMWARMWSRLTGW